MESPPPSASLAVRTGGIARRIATIVVRARWLILALWLAGAGASYFLLQGPGALPSSSLYALIPRNTPAFHAIHEEKRLFGTSILPQIAIVQRSTPLRPAAQRTIVRTGVQLDHGRLARFPAGSAAVPVVNDVPFLPGTRETATTAITYLGFPSGVSFAKQRELARHYARVLSRRSGVAAKPTGLIPGGFQESDTISSHLNRVELVSIVLVLLMVALYLRSVLAAVVTLFAAVVVYLLTSRAVTYLAQTTGITLHRETEPIVAVLLLGVITDYSVFFLSGMRDRMRAGAAPREAARDTTAQFLPIVFAAGLLVAAGLATLQVASVGFVQALGPGLALVVVITLAVALTFTPSAMSVLGRATFWPGLRGEPAPEDAPEQSRGHRLRRRVAAALSQKRTAAAAAVLVVLVLGGAATGLGGIRLGMTVIRGLPPNAAPHRGATEAAQGFAAGAIAPTELIVQRRGIRGDPLRLARFGRLLEQVPGVAVAFGAGIPSAVPGASVFRSPHADAVRYLVAFEDSPFSSKAVSELGRLRQRMPQLLARAHLAGANVAYAGDTPIARDTVDRIEHDLWLVGLSVLCVNLILLGFYLRAVVAPLYLVAGSALAIAATFGITTYVFEGLLGYQEVTYYIPLAAGVLLAAFGSDYNLFVVGRIWQEARVHAPERAIVSAVPRASRAISVAALALALSFASLTLVPLRSFREFGFTVALGVLVDTMLVRTFLIPSLVTLTGRVGFWPSGRGE